MEQWKDVVGYEGVYQISSYGRIKSVARKVGCKNGSFRWLPEKIITPLFAKGGYLNIVGSRKQVRSTLIIHQLVAEHFIGPRPQGCVIDHIDRNRTNNQVDNLRYVTPSENQRNRKDNKLTAQKVEQILKELKELSQSKVAEKYGVCQALISKIKNGKVWKSV